MVTSDALRLSLASAWQEPLGAEFAKPYMRDLVAFLAKEEAAEKTIFPPRVDLFRALNETIPGKIKVVILGQDPYHGMGQAHGLSFSVPAGEPLPPSLRNIFKELATDLGVAPPTSGHLQHWAEQGVLLLNAVLTVESGRANSHSGRGWESFTDRVLTHLSEAHEGIAFVLWGAYATKKFVLIDPSKHLVLTSAHPSPLSAHRGFFGSRPFSRINAYLAAHGRASISWA